MSRFDEELSALSGRRVAVLGMGISNRPLLHLLMRAGARITVRDKQSREKLDPTLCAELVLSGAAFRCGEDYLEDLCEEVIFRSPGIMASHPALRAAAEGGARITSEMELFFETCPCPIIGITGSDGKSTTTTLVAEMLRAAGHRVHLGGNIGHPLLSDVPDIAPTDFAVVELSSFQLMSMTRSPAVSIITNITPNHLDKHRDMAEYVEAKREIFRHQDSSGLVVLNADNDLTAASALLAPGRVRLFSRGGNTSVGVILRDSVITLCEGEKELPLISTADILLPGLHNVENYMAAAAAVAEFVPPEAMRRVAKSFAGVPHRLELVAEIDGVRYYNSSIDSSPTRTAAALSCFDRPVIVLAGGADKGIPLEPLGPLFREKAKGCILVGHTAERIRNAVCNSPDYDADRLPVRIEENMEAAVAAARSLAVPGDIVILSPGCTSFDLYANFEERGERFRAAVRAMLS
ncbi:MAG: UDP-N-acetylmuramoyl-L-alanine--D-glutamate ligase [Clostridia bacterium]|nr:UDP-N-acetylmuramoyl-L-alanine--D-glutamate ligase [Clostridia bacterium]